MIEIPIPVNVSHIAGIVPHAAYPHGCFLKVVKVSFHYEVSLYHDSADLSWCALFTGLVVFNPDLHAWHGLADTPGTVKIRGIHGDNRRGFGGAVSFVESQVVFLPEFLPQGFGAFVSAADSVLDALKTPRLGLSQIPPVETRSGSHDGRLLFPDNGTDCLIIERVGDGNDCHSHDKWQPEVYSEPEHMETNISVSELDSFGVFFTSAGKEDGGSFALISGVNGPEYQRQGYSCDQGSFDFIQGCYTFHDVFNEDHAVENRAVYLF